MQRPSTAVLGSIAWFVIAAGLGAAWVPWLITGWKVGYSSPIGWVAQAVGVALIVLGLVPVVRTFVEFARAGGTPVPGALPRHLVVSGFNRYVRNPIYLGTLIVIVGEALLLGRVSLLAYAALVWLVTAGFVWLYEEPTLASRFGPDYEAYRRAVPAWRPRAHPWSPAASTTRAEPCIAGPQDGQIAPDEGGAPTMTDTLSLQTPAATLVYDVRGPLPPAAGRPPLMMVGHPMDASGFGALASYFPRRTVVTYDPRGLARSTRRDGRADHTPEQNADDIHRIVEALGCGPVELFASSGGAVSALALVTAHPGDVTLLVAHEPPLIALLPDADRAFAAQRAVRAAYDDKGWGYGMAGFIAMTSWKGEFDDDFAARPAPDPASFGLPVDDDGFREDPLLSGVSDAVSAYRPDLAALAAAPTRVVVAVGVESEGLMTGRTSVALAHALGQEATVFPSHHGGFVGGDGGWAGQPEAFAARLHEVLDDG